MQCARRQWSSRSSSSGGRGAINDSLFFYIAVVVPSPCHAAVCFGITLGAEHRVCTKLLLLLLPAAAAQPLRGVLLLKETSSGFLCLCLLLPRYFPGPYDDYAEAKALASLASSRQAAALDKQRKHIEASISSAEKQARQVCRSPRPYALA
jgi:hypothetical protein